VAGLSSYPVDNMPTAIPVPIAEGGTASATAATACVALGASQLKGNVIECATTGAAYWTIGSAPAGYIIIARGGTEVARINIGFGQTEMCRWVVPTVIDGVTYAGAWLKSLNFNVGTSDKANVFLVTQSPADVMPRVKRYYGNVQGPIPEDFTSKGAIAGSFLAAMSVTAP